MSVEAISWCLQQQTGDARSKLLLLCICNYADENGHCWPSQSILAEQTEQSIDTVQRRLDALEGGGFIRREKRVRDNGSYTTDLIVVNAPFARAIPQTAVRHAAASGGGYRSTAGGDTALGRYPEPSLNRHLKKDGNSHSGKRAKGGDLWIQADDPRWASLAERFKRERDKFPIPYGSRHYPGVGYPFPSDWLEKAAA